MKVPLTIEVYCNPDEAGITQLRENLSTALQRRGYPPLWDEYYKGHIGVPRRFIKYSSPAVVINGHVACQKKDSILTTEAVEKMLDQGATNWRRFRIKLVLSNHLSFLLAVLIAFFPKCPFCWMAYMSALSFLGFQSIPYQPWMLPFFILLLVINLFALFQTRKRHRYIPLTLGALGAFIIVNNRIFIKEEWLVFPGIFFLIAASLWNSLSGRIISSIRGYFAAQASAKVY